MKTKKPSLALCYESVDGTVEVYVQADDNTVWLTQKQLAEIFRVEVAVISNYISVILNTNELPDSTVSQKQVVDNEGRKVDNEFADFYNLDMIIAVGYRIDPYETTRFRVWAETLFITVKKLQMPKNFINASGAIKPKETLPTQKDEPGIDNFSKLLKGLLNVPPPKKDIK